MNDYAWAGQVSGPLAIVAGVLICFFGYRILKISLALIGFVVGAYGGWEFGISLIHSSPGLALVCALIGGLVGMGLCLWLYLVGIFLLGATAGAVVAGALFNGAGHQIQPLVLWSLPVAFGLIALVAQKFMIVVSTAFSGAYLITAGVWPFVVAAGQNPSRIWLHPSQNGPPGTLGYAALIVWVVLALIGVSFQFRSRRGKVEPEVKREA